MNIKQLFADDDAVSPVIGVILMVAITVILAAVIGAFVLDIGGNQEAAPQANFDWEFENTAGGTNNLKVLVTHGGGGSVNADQLSLGENLGSGGASCNLHSGTLSAGDTVVDSSGSGSKCNIQGSVNQGDALQIIWTSSDGGSTQIISEEEAP